MEQRKDWPPVRRKKKKMPLLYKYWPPIRLGLIVLVLIAILCLTISSCGKIVKRLGGDGKIPETTVTTTTVETMPSQEVIQQMAEDLMKEAEFVAAGYDYNKAIQMLESFEYYDQVPELAAAANQYAQLDMQLVSYPNMNEVTHVFFHSLIVDPARAFDDDYTNGGYNQYMTTIDEFVAMMEEMYARDYVLVSPYDVAYEVTDAQGTRFVYGDIRLPAGKKPFIMSQDDVNYYGYMIGATDGVNDTPAFADTTGDGFAHRIVIGEDGYPTCEYMDAQGNVTTGDYDLVPVLVSHLPEAANKIFAEYEPKRTPAQWAFRWLWNQPEVTVVLSGMNSQEMVEDNIQTASTTQIGELGEKEEEMLRQVVKAINSKMKVGCTGCGYCMPCPKNVDIPGTFAAYNRRYQEGKFYALKDYFMCTALRKTSTAASNCVGCGKCEKHCPQGIPIRQKLKDAQKELEGPVYQIAKRVFRLFVRL